MDKFGRNYILVVTKQDGTPLTILPPFTLEFDITRNTLTSANVCSIRIYNLSEKNRNQIRYNASNYGQDRPVVLKAGYGSNLSVLFSGNISQAWSVREGNNFVTQIESYAGGFAFVNGITNTQYAANTTQTTIIRDLISSLPGVSVGAVGNYDYPPPTGRGKSYNGTTVDILNELTGGGFFVDNGKGYALGTNEYVEDGVSPLIISAKSGLLGTPILEETTVRFDMLFNPSLNIGRKILLESITDSNFNGFYKVTAVKHRGMISAAVCGDATTTGEFFFTKILSPVAGSASV